MRHLLVLFFLAAFLYGCCGSDATSAANPAPEPTDVLQPAKSDATPAPDGEESSAAETAAVPAEQVAVWTPKGQTCEWALETPGDPAPDV